MTTVEILRAARALIAEQARWTQGGFARNLVGYPDGACSPRAVCWCAAGAMMRVIGGPWSVEYRDAMNALAHSVGRSVDGWNDSSTHADVIAGFDKAIAAEEAKETR